MPKFAVVTGGAGGIGQAVAGRLAKDNCAIIILDLNDQAGKKVTSEFARRGIEISFHCADLTQEARVQSVFDQIQAGHGAIDVLVNVAGGSMHRHPVEVFPLTNWQSVIDANLTSTFLCCRAVAAMLEVDKGWEP